MLPYKNIFLLILIISSQNLFARSPAVLPTRGISIDEFKQITPKQAKAFGYQFTKGLPKSVNDSERKVINNGDIVLQNIKKNANSSIMSIPIFITLFILSIPLFLWFFMIRTIDHAKTDGDINKNVIPLNNDQKEDRDDHSKVS